MSAHWRRFVPRTLQRKSVERGGVFDEAESLVAHATLHLRRRNADITQLDPIIDRLRGRQDIDSLLAMLILQSPRAANAQRQMDKHPHGYHDKTKRLYELIDFNDVFVACVLAMPADQLSTFNEQAKLAMDRFCKKLGTKCFSNEQWEAITHGLSREVAVFRGAIHEGLTATMTSRVEDAKGVDMIIGDETGKSINADIKTRSAFFFRLKELAREGRLSESQWHRADELGYCQVMNGHGHEGIEVVLVRIDHEVLGPITDFTFENSGLLGQQLRKIIAECGRHHH